MIYNIPLSNERDLKIFLNEKKFSKIFILCGKKSFYKSILCKKDVNNKIDKKIIDIKKYCFIVINNGS